MNWADQEALKNMSKRGKPGPRLVRGLIWAAIAIFIISILIMLAIMLAASRADPAF